MAKKVLLNEAFDEKKLAKIQALGNAVDEASVGVADTLNDPGYCTESDLKKKVTALDKALAKLRVALGY